MGTVRANMLTVTVGDQNALAFFTPSSSWSNMWVYGFPSNPVYGLARASLSFPSLSRLIEMITSGSVFMALMTAGSALSKLVLTGCTISVGAALALTQAAYSASETL